MATFESNSVNESNFDATAAGLLSPQDDFELFGEPLHKESDAAPDFAFRLGGTGHCPIDEPTESQNLAGAGSTVPIKSNGVNLNVGSIYDQYLFNADWWTLQGENDGSDPFEGLGPIIAHNESQRQIKQSDPAIDPAIQPLNALAEQNIARPVIEAVNPSPETIASQAAAQSYSSGQPDPPPSSQSSFPSQDTTENPPQSVSQTQLATPLSLPALAPQPAPVAPSAVTSAPNPLQAPVTVIKRKKPGRKPIPDGLPGDTPEKAASRRAQRKHRLGKEAAKAAEAGAAALAAGPSLGQIDQSIQDIQMEVDGQPTLAQIQPAVAEQSQGTASVPTTNSQLSYGLHYQQNGDLHIVVPQGPQAQFMAQQYLAFHQVPAQPYNPAAQYYQYEPRFPTTQNNQCQQFYPLPPYNQPQTYYQAPSSNSAPSYNSTAQYNAQMQCVTASQPMPAMSFNQSHYPTM